MAHFIREFTFRRLSAPLTFHTRFGRAVVPVVAQLVARRGLSSDKLRDFFHLSLYLSRRTPFRETNCATFEICLSPSLSEPTLERRSERLSTLVSLPVSQNPLSRDNSRDIRVCRATSRAHRRLKCDKLRDFCLAAQEKAPDHKIGSRKPCDSERSTDAVNKVEIDADDLAVSDFVAA